MKTLWQSGSSMAAGVIILTTGYIDGLWTGRWRASTELAACAARVERLPLVIGDWKARAEELGAEDIDAAGIQGYTLRSYRQQRTNRLVSVLLMCGRPGPMSVHSPDICYPGIGFEPTAPPAREVHQFGSEHAEFWCGRFARQEVAGANHVQILWAWGTAGEWTAPVNPRLTFARMPALYKLYVIQSLPSSGDKAEREAGSEFLRQLLPELKLALGGAIKPSEPAANE